MICRIHRCSRILFIVAAIAVIWHGTLKLRPKYVHIVTRYKTAFLRNRGESYLINFVENIDNLTVVIDDIVSSFPEVEILHIYPKTKAVALENVSPNCLSFLQTYSDMLGVLYIEPDFDVQAMRVQEDLNQTLEWGLDRIDGKLDNKYHYDLTGKGVRVYVIDSGIRFNHVEFRRDPSEVQGETPKSRARCAKNFRKGFGEDCADEWGHGTHIAALIGMCRWSR